MVRLAELVKQHLDFDRSDVAALAELVALVLNTVYWQYTRAGYVAESVQMLHEPLLAIALAACRPLLNDGYAIHTLLECIMYRQKTMTVTVTPVGSCQNQDCHHTRTRLLMTRL